MLGETSLGFTLDREMVTYFSRALCWLLEEQGTSGFGGRILKS